MHEPIIEISTIRPISTVGANRNLTFAITALATVAVMYYADQLSEEFKKTRDFFTRFYDCITYLNHISAASPSEFVQSGVIQKPISADAPKSPTKKQPEEAVTSPIKTPEDFSNHFSSEEPTKTHADSSRRASSLFPRARSSGDVILVDHGIDDEEDELTMHANTSPNFRRHFTPHH